MVGWMVGWLDSWINGLGWTAWPGCRRLARLNRWLFGKGAKRNAKCQSQAQNRDQKHLASRGWSSGSVAVCASIMPKMRTDT